MLKVAFLWHMHQPYYCDPSSGNMVLPWVRLHCLKDYYDLPYRVGKYDNLKMTFNLVPSLIEQIDLYVSGKATDRHLELTQKSTADLTREEKAEVFSLFFSAHPVTMIEPYPCYRRLHKKLLDCHNSIDMAARTTTVQEIRDLIVWGNLTWIDPIFRSQQPYKRLFAKGEKFTEEDKQDLITAQLKILSETLNVYKSLQDDGKIEVSFTPYFHPIMPLICDTESAREALPAITLPKNRFCYPEDAEKQVAMAVEMYTEKFGRNLVGMWPSEGSVSEQMAPLLVKHGIQWMASDEQVLFASLGKAGRPSSGVSAHRTWLYTTPEGPITIFFRDHGLSDRIGFVYSSWDEQKAVEDFIGHLHRMEEFLSSSGDDTVVPIILDGENCWEYYPHDGDTFLKLLFDRLATDDRLETVTFAEALKLKPEKLPAILAGSWINHNFRIWIGHPEDNTAWDLLWAARKAFAAFREKHPDFDPNRLARAEKSLLIAEGSDWNWWYGDEHRGGHNDVFDRIYRNHLASVYTALGLDVPRNLLTPITDAFPEMFATEPEGTVTPLIDGILTHYYEWLGAGKFNCRKAGGAMHRVDQAIEYIHFVSDDDRVYLRTDFAERKYLADHPRQCLKLEILNPGHGIFLFSAKGIESIPDWAEPLDTIEFAAADIAEISLPKKIFFPEKKGEIFFKIGIVEGSNDVELWPQGDPIRFAFAGEGEEIVWDI